MYAWFIHSCVMQHMLGNRHKVYIENWGLLPCSCSALASPPSPGWSRARWGRTPRSSRRTSAPTSFLLMSTTSALYASPFILSSNYHLIITSSPCQWALTSQLSTNLSLCYHHPPFPKISLRSSWNVCRSILGTLATQTLCCKHSTSAGRSGKRCCKRTRQRLCMQLPSTRPIWISGCLSWLRIYGGSLSGRILGKHLWRLWWKCLSTKVVAQVLQYKLYLIAGAWVQGQEQED